MNENSIENLLIIAKLKNITESEGRNHVWLEDPDTVRSMKYFHRSHWLLTLIMCLSKYDRGAKIVLSVEFYTP